jgi:hypothetical protein
MNLRKKALASLIVAGLFLTTASVKTQEQTLKKEDVPKAVLEAFKKSYPDANIKGFSRELQGNAFIYEVESSEGKINRDVAYDKNGILISIEETLPFTDLPAAVRSSLQNEFPNATIKKSEKLTKGKRIQYEIVLEIKKKMWEVLFNSDGVIQKKERSNEH